MPPALLNLDLGRWFRRGTDIPWADFESALLRVDIGPQASRLIIERLREAKPADAQAARQSLTDILTGILTPCERPVQLSGSPCVLLLVGVNGSGKTTLAAKLAAQSCRAGQKVVLAACDTFRAAAVEQLQSWGERLQVPVVSRPGADPASVAFDAVEQAQAQQADLLIVDSAGRQSTRDDLMRQLEKVARVLAKAAGRPADQIWLVADANSGQNVLAQISAFNTALGLTGLCINKLDGSAHGGILVAAALEFSLPVHYLGVGEEPEALEVFTAAQFAQALVATTDS